MVYQVIPTQTEFIPENLRALCALHEGSMVPTQHVAALHIQGTTHGIMPGKRYPSMRWSDRAHIQKIDKSFVPDAEVS